MELTIRFATAADAETIVSFVRGLAEYEREPDAVELTAAQLAAELESDAALFECLIAEADGAPVGFALFFRNYSTWRGRPGLFLEDIFVPEAFRGRGVGRALMRRLAQVASERGWGRMEWSVLNWNTLAQDFYRKAGGLPLTEWTTWRIEGEALKRLAHR
jgi:GNAT superfamily N-acetyltransferase